MMRLYKQFLILWLAPSPVQFPPFSSHMETGCMQGDGKFDADINTSVHVFPSLCASPVMDLFHSVPHGSKSSGTSSNPPLTLDGYRFGK